MAKARSVYICSECGASALQWFGICPSCGAGNTLQEKLADLQNRIKRIEAHAENNNARLNTLNNQLPNVQNLKP